MTKRSNSPPMINAPLLVLGLGGLLLVMHGLRLLLPEQMQDMLLYNSALIPERFWSSGSALSYDNFLEAAIPLFSHAFLHADWTHVTFNSVFLIAVGKSVYEELNTHATKSEGGGGAGFLLVFVMSVIFGGAVHLLAYYPEGPAAIGASGGVSGLFAGAFLVMQKRMDGGGIRLLSRRFMVMSGAFIIGNLVLAYAGPLVFGMPIAWQAHIGGFVAGALVFRLLAWRKGL